MIDCRIADLINWATSSDANNRWDRPIRVEHSFNLLYLRSSKNKAHLEWADIDNVRRKLEDAGFTVTVGGDESNIYLSHLRPGR